MSRYVFKLPDLGEGTVESEIGNWLVQPGERVAEDQPMVEMMTDKAAVEVPAPVSGVVVSLAGKPGDRIAVGGELIVIETAAEAAGPGARATGAASTAARAAPPTAPLTPVAVASAQPAAARVLTSPAVRRRAQEAGVDLARLTGSGPGGRILQSDLDGALQGRAAAPVAAVRAATAATQEIPVIGVRRVIAERMSAAVRDIPHFSYVEEVDVTELEALRAHLNDRRAAGEPALSYLPFIVAGLARVLGDFPQCNAHHDPARNVIVRHAAVHVGIATQTPEGLKVPVVRDVGHLALAELAAALRTAAERARAGKSTRAELSGSTITVTSLGRLGGIASTPIINAPEVAIIGVNRAVERPVVRHGTITTRLLMNLSSSFDHRFVDGHDGAAMIQALKDRLEHPATIFI